MDSFCYSAETYITKIPLTLNLDEERKCLWGLLGKEWELKQATVSRLGEPLDPEPLPQFDAVTSLAEWSNLICDYSDAWLVGFMAYKSKSFSLEERCVNL